MSSNQQTAESLVTVGGKRPKKRISAAQRAKKRKIQKLSIGGGLFLLAIIIWYGLQPLKGDADYGICRTYAELKANNPETMRIISYENYGRAWKIFYTFTGQYGEQRSNIIDCTFSNDANGQIIARDIKINRVSIGGDAVAAYNKSIPAVLAGKPDLVIPPPLEKTDLRGLRTIIIID